VTVFIITSMFSRWCYCFLATIGHNSKQEKACEFTHLECMRCRVLLIPQLVASVSYFLSPLTWGYHYHFRLVSCFRTALLFIFIYIF